MIKTTPPMGWNSWNTFGHNISADLIYEIADAMVEEKLLDAGYEYVIIDDCWSLRRRGADGRLVPDPAKFPEGMKKVGDYLHKKGLKFGLYSSCGLNTCANFPGSYGHEFVDAETFASWGVDYLKYDYCYRPAYYPSHLLYKRMGLALANCGSDILFSACSWGADGTPEWIKSTGAHTWRSTGDIFDSWESISKLALQQTNIQPYNGWGCFNDMDMLVVGMNGKGNVGLTGCTFEEYRTHFSLWAMLNSPLIIGCDVRSMTPETKSILLNREIIAINQDISGRQPYLACCTQDLYIWVKLLEGGDLAIGMFNFADESQLAFIPWSNIGLERGCGKALSLRDLWKGEELGVFDEQYCCTVEGHGCVMLRARLVG